MSPETLIHRYLDDRSGLEPAELDELIALLKAEPARAVALREQLLLDDLLAQKLSVDRRNFPAQVGQRIADYHRGEQEMDNQVSDLRELAEREFEKPSTWSGSSPWVKYIALAATVLIAAVIIVPRFLPKGPQAVAKVTAVTGDVQLAGGQPVDVEVGIAVMTGQQIVTPAGASLSLEYADKTIVQVAGDSTVAIDLDDTTGGKQISLDRGAITAMVSKQDPDAPLRITTPHAIATVVGTTFRLMVTAEKTLLDVAEGTVVLDRLDDGESITVDANETGLATGERLQLREVSWPEDHQSVAFLYSPFDFLNMSAPAKVSRSPESGKLWDAHIDSVGSAALNEFTAAVELTGGYLKSDEAGADLLEALKDKSDLTLEIVLQPAQADQAGPARIVTLADDGQTANLALVQDGKRLAFQLRTSADQKPQTLRFEAAKAGQRSHLVCAYRDGLLAIYRDGVEFARSEEFHGSLADWHEGPLTLGADASGKSPWQGTIEAVAIHARCLEPDEVERNSRAYRVLAAPESK
jgi:hypothetical protein